MGTRGLLAPGAPFFLTPLLTHLTHFASPTRPKPRVCSPPHRRNLRFLQNGNPRRAVFSSLKPSFPPGWKPAAGHLLVAETFVSSRTEDWPLFYFVADHLPPSRGIIVTLALHTTCFSSTIERRFCYSFATVSLPHTDSFAPHSAFVHCLQAALVRPSL